VSEWPSGLFVYIFTVSEFGFGSGQNLSIFTNLALLGPTYFGHSCQRTKNNFQFDVLAY